MVQYFRFYSSFSLFLGAALVAANEEAFDSPHSTWREVTLCQLTPNYSYCLVMMMSPYCAPSRGLGLEKE